MVHAASAHLRTIFARLNQRVPYLRRTMSDGKRTMCRTAFPHRRTTRTASSLFFLKGVYRQRVVSTPDSVPNGAGGGGDSKGRQRTTGADGDSGCLKASGSSADGGRPSGGSSDLVRWVVRDRIRERIDAAQPTPIAYCHLAWRRGMMSHRTRARGHSCHPFCISPIASSTGRS
jgi:hypothetical protein